MKISTADTHEELDFLKQSFPSNSNVENCGDLSDDSDIETNANKAKVLFYTSYYYSDDSD